MATQYSGGTYINTTFTGDTKLNIANNVITNLLKAGWTAISGALNLAAAPTIAGSGSGGTLAAATYQYAVTFTNATGETTIGASSAQYVASGGASSVALTVIPTQTGATGRKVYRSTDGGTTWLLVNTIADNTTTTWTDTGAAAGAAAPTVNTTGTATANALLQSAQASGSNNQGRVRIKDNGGVCIAVTIENVSGTKAGTQSTNFGGLLFPASAKTWRILASRYRFEVFTPGASVSRDFVMAGILYIPGPYQGVVTEAIYLASNGINDTNTSTTNSPRMGAPPWTGNETMICNGNLIEFGNNTTSDTGHFAFRIGAPFYSNTYGTGTRQAEGYNNMYRWHDLALEMSDILAGWATSNVDAEALIRGQMYDWTCISDLFTQDTTDTWSDAGTSHTWFCLTPQWSPFSGAPRNSFWIATS